MSQDTQLPDYVASATPNPKDKRAGWLMTTAASYAGVMLWFVFWQSVPTGGQAGIQGGTLAGGLGFALLSLVVAAFLCHFLFYLVPGMLGMKTGLSLAVVGTSTYGVKGGFIMPGFLMGALQFGWLGVNAFFAGELIANYFGGASGGMLHMVLGVVWIVLATFVGMKGVKYVGMVGSFMPILPIIVLCLLLFSAIGGISDFDVDKMMTAAAEKQAAAAKTLEGDTAALAAADIKGLETIAKSAPASLFGSLPLGVFSLMCAYVIGFFATAGAAGVDFGSGNKDAASIQKAGLVGIVLITVVTGTIALLTVAGIQKSLPPELLATLHVTDENLFKAILGNKAGICMLLLAIAAFPSACFPTVVAANAFKTTFPKINPLITCGLGVLVAILLVVTKAAGQAGDVFSVVGASFGPICGAMVADYLLSGRKWAGPRAGFNPAGWISWFFGFVVGATPWSPNSPARACRLKSRVRRSVRLSSGSRFIGFVPKPVCNPSRSTCRNASTSTPRD